VGLESWRRSEDRVQMKISLREAAGGNAVTGCWGVEGKPPRRVSRPADLRNCSPELKIEYVRIDPTQQHE